MTGGAGFIGRRLVEELVARGKAVAVVDSGETGRPDLLHDGVEVIDRDIAGIETDEWRQLIESTGTERVFHLAARKYNTPGVTFDQMQQANLTATWRLGEACAACSPCRVILASSLYVYPLQNTVDRKAMAEVDPAAPFTAYGVTKLAAEGALASLRHAHGLDWYATRLYFVYGPGQFAEGGYKSVVVSNLERIRRGEPPRICGDGLQTLDYIFVEDVVGALLALAELPAKPNGPRVFNLASGNPYSIEFLTQEMLAVSGSSLEPEFIDADWTDGTWRVGDPGLIEREIGWRPTTTLEEGLKSVWEDISGTGG